MVVVGAAIEEYVPRAKPSPYAKRYWTEDLIKLRSDYTCQRNKASRARRQVYRERNLEQSAQTAKRVYYKALRQQKKSHWDDFSEDAENIWQASRYMVPGQDTSALFSPIPFLQKSETVLAN